MHPRRRNFQVALTPGALSDEPVAVQRTPVPRSGPGLGIGAAGSAWYVADPNGCGMRIGCIVAVRTPALTTSHRLWLTPATSATIAAGR
jgi:hypothetical protein